MNTRNIAILLVLTAVISAGITRYYFPQVQFKNVETTKEVVKNDIRNETKTIKHPDGTIEIVSNTIDESTRKETESSTTTIAEKPQWMFDVGARTPLTNLTLVYDLHAQRRILGPFFLGASASTDKTLGVSVGMEF